MDTSLTAASVGESLPLLRSLQRVLPSPRLGRHWRASPLGEGGGGEDREGGGGNDGEALGGGGEDRDKEERAWLRASPGELATASFTLLFSSTSMIELFLPVFSVEMVARSCMSKGDMIGRRTF